MDIKIEQQDANQRLDMFLSSRLPELSRAKIQKFIKNGQIKVNGESANSHYSVKENDMLAINTEPLAQTVAAKKDIAQAIIEKIQLLEQTDDYLIINKPAGLIIHGAEHLQEYNLVDWLLERYPEIKGVGEDEQRPGIVHRIDKDVSGIVLVVRTQKAFAYFKKLFQTRRIKKIYTALSFGRIAREEGTIEFVIDRATSGHKMAARPSNQAGKPSISEFKILKRFINYTLLQIRIKTGRTHQIRAHLAAYGHPIVGDDLYGTSKTKIQNKKLQTTRIYLCATELSFKDLQGEKQSYKIDLPVEFEEMLKQIK
jgi:23S rRNA pseudouridine1911/1915/1917 synthase